MRHQELLTMVLLAAALPVAAAVTGTVVRPDGTPVANARVVVLRPVAAFDVDATFLAEPEKPLATAVTDAKGAFAASVEGRGLILLRVEADGFAPLDAVVPMGEEAGRIALRAMPVVEGHVKADGKPVAGVEVLVVSSGNVLSRYTTDAKGSYRVPDPRVWAKAIVVRHGDYAAVAQPPADHDFVLAKGRAIDGRVIDANNKPVGGARVELNSIVVTTSAADGTFHFAHAPAGAAWVSARSAEGIGKGQVASGGTTVKLRSVGRISGIVQDAEKHPLAGVGVVATGMESGDAAVTGSDGAFSISVPRGKYGLTDAGDEIFDFQSEANATGGDVRVEVTATRRPAVEGVVRNVPGDTIPSAWVNLLCASNGEYLCGSHVLTDEEGRFRLRLPVIAGVTVRAMAMKPGLPIGVSKALTASSHNLTITLPDGTSLGGRVVDGDGHPVAGVAITPVVGKPAEPEMALPDVTAVARLDPWATTGDDGRFSGRMELGSMTFSFAKDGYVDSLQEVSVVGQTKPVGVTLVRAARLTGRVLRKDGTLVAGASVLAGERVVVTADDGSFRVDGIRPGVQDVFFGANFDQQQSVNAPADDVKLVLPPMRTVRGRVVDGATGAPVEKFVVFGDRLQRDELPFESQVGEFGVELPEGETSVGVRAEGYAPAVKVKVDTDRPLVISLSHGRTIRGHLTDEKGQPLGGVAYGNSFELHDESSSDQRQSGGDGRYEVTGLSPDNGVNVTFHKNGFVTTQRRVNAGHDDVTLDVTLRRGLAVSGRVVDRNGVGVPDVSVSAGSAAHGSESESVRTGQEGGFRFDALGPARWNFKVEREGTLERGAVKDVDIEKVQELTITLESSPVATIFGHVSGLDPSWTARVVTVRNLDEVWRTVQIDAAGDYRMENAPAGSIDVFATAGVMMRQTKSVSAEVAAGAELRIDLAFAPQVVVHGLVTCGGAPLEGATVRFGHSRPAPAGADGGYSLLVDPGEYDATVGVGGKDLPFSQHVIVTGPAEVNLAVDIASITAMVVDDAGQPLPGAKVTAAPHGHTHAAAETVTGADGTAMLEVAGGESDTIVAALPGYANATQDVTASGTSSVTLHMVRSPGATVRIVDMRDGRTLGGYAIARDASGRVIASASDPEPDGTMLLPVPPGTYRFSASAENYGSHTIQAEVPSGEIRLALPRGGALALRAHSDLHATAQLIQPNGEEYVRCWCSGIADITISGRSTLVDQVAPGTYTLEVTPAGGKPRKYPVTVLEGVTTPVAID